MKLNFSVYDADHHLYEPEDAFLRHLPQQYASDFYFAEVRGRKKLVINGVVSEYIPNPTFTKVAAPGTHEVFYRAQNHQGLSMKELSGRGIEQPEEWRSAAGRLAMMDRQGLYGALLFPTLASVIEARLADKPKTMGALFHSLNMWLADEFGFAKDGRLFAVPMVNLADLDQALATLEFVLAKGARLIAIRPAPVATGTGTVSFAYEEFDPFWSRVADAGIFVAMHASDSGYDAIARSWAGTGREYQPFARGALQSVLDGLGRAVSDAIAAMICHGLFDRHPKLRVVSVENGAAWVDPLLYRLKRADGQMPQAFKAHPVDLFHKHVFVAPFYEDNTLELKRRIPVERIVFGSDFPHPEGLAEPLGYLKEFEGYSQEELRRVFHSNLKGLLEGARD
jgi:predicted TIM-barrel fold metal-dependent hydrolase